MNTYSGEQGRKDTGQEALGVPTWPAERNISQRWWKERFWRSQWSQSAKIQWQVENYSSQDITDHVTETAGNSPHIMFHVHVMKGCGWYTGQPANQRQPVAKKLELNGLNKGKRQRPLVNETTGSAWAGSVKDAEGDIISGACFRVKDVSSGSEHLSLPSWRSCRFKTSGVNLLSLIWRRDRQRNSRLLGRATSGDFLQLNTCFRRLAVVQTLPDIQGWYNKKVQFGLEMMCFTNLVWDTLNQLFYSRFMWLWH